MVSSTTTSNKVQHFQRLSNIEHVALIEPGCHCSKIPSVQKERWLEYQPHLIVDTNSRCHYMNILEQHLIQQGLQAVDLGFGQRGSISNILPSRPHEQCLSCQDEASFNLLTLIQPIIASGHSFMDQMIM